MAQYLDSSQYLKWYIKDAKLLRELREERYKYALHRVMEKHQANSESADQHAGERAADTHAGALESVSETASNSHKRHSEEQSKYGRPAKRQCVGQLDFPTLDEELLMLRAYEQRIIRLCATLKFKPAIQATAMSFFKRFYVTRSPLIIRPDDIIHTVIVLAIKVEACPYTEVSAFIHQLSTFTGMEQGKFMENEMIVLAGLDFDLTIHHPFRALRGFLRLLQTDTTVSSDVHASSNWRNDPLGKLEFRAKSLAFSSLTTDAPLLFTPGQIALACLQLSVHKDTSQLPSSSMNEVVPEAIGASVESLAEKLCTADPLQYANADLFGDCVGGKDAESLKSSMNQENNSNRQKTDLANKLESLRKMIFDAAREPDVAPQVREICQRFSSLVDPSMVPGTPTYNARQDDKSKVLKQREEEKQARRQQNSNEASGTDFLGFGRALFT